MLMMMMTSVDVHSSVTLNMSIIKNVSADVYMTMVIKMMTMILITLETVAVIMMQTIMMMIRAMTTMIITMRMMTLMTTVKMMMMMKMIMNYTGVPFQSSFFLLETKIDKTISPQGPFSICSGAFNHIT